MTAEKHWIVTLSSGRPFPDLRKDLVDAGFSVEQELTELGVVTGTCDDEVAGKLRALPGVTDVAADERIDIGPPGSPSTW